MNTQITRNTQLIKGYASKLGFLSCGISEACFLEDEAPKLEKWLNQNHHGKMNYMENHFDKRLDPRKLVPGAKSVVSLLLNYYTDKNQYDTQAPKISKYAFGEDYHYVIKKKLKKFLKFISNEIGEVQGRVFVDSAPVMEKPIAEKAGLGWIGKHTNLINRDNGSWFFIGEIYSNIRFDIDKKEDNFCGSCSNCISACPTNAIVAPYKLDARKCISYLTIENKGVIPLKYRKRIGNRIFGCDDCQLVCPWNKFAKKTDISYFNSNKGLDNISLLELFSWSEKKFKKETESSPINRINYNQWLRNIAIGLGNSNKSKEIILSLERKKNKVSDLNVIEHIDWAIEQQT